MATLTREEARQYIDKIRKTNGGFTAQHFEFLAQDPEVFEIVSSLRETSGKACRSVSENLNSSQTRFVYELIQNAEDTSYRKTQETPHLSFTLYENRVEIDSNEDGFTEEDVTAICKIHSSSKAKTQSQDHIGEKGIGFKSVFTLAKEVWIQSEPFSFKFFNRPDDPMDGGMGLITPFNEPHVQLPHNVQTRFTLYLKDDCDRERVRREFVDLPATFLLFMKKLKRLSIKIDISPHYHVSYSLQNTKSRIGRTLRAIEKRDLIQDTQETRRYWTISREIDEMPVEPLRENVASADVVLAFPLDHEEQPVNEIQDVYAFLPMRSAGFNFLIHGDFITVLNREDISDVPWNLKLLDQISSLFIEAVVADDGFGDHPSLKYSWVRYLPPEEGTSSLWGRLNGSIRAAAQDRNLFFSWTDESLVWPASELLIMDPEYRDADGEPLLRDLSDETSAYVSDNYSTDLDIPVLRGLGAKSLSIPDFLARLREDLSSDDSIMRKPTTPEDWHTRVADILIKACSSAQLREQIELLGLIPITGGKWIRRLGLNVYLPTSDGARVPSGLLSTVVDHKALSNDKRRELFAMLSILECPPRKVIELIEGLGAREIDRSESDYYEDAVFLFHHQDKMPKLYSRYLMVSRTPNGRVTELISTSCNTCTIYTPNSSHVSAMCNVQGDDAPGELADTVRYLDGGYALALRNRWREGMSAMQWLTGYAGAEEFPRLQRSCDKKVNQKLSSEIRWIAKNRPEKLFRVLKASQKDLVDCDEWYDFFKYSSIPVTSESQTENLDWTWLPLPKLKTKVAELGLANSFEFIQELDGMSDSDAANWQFLDSLGVGVSENVSFWTTALKQARNNDLNKDVIFKIYSRLQTYVEKGDKEIIKGVFKEDVVLIPGDADHPDTWEEVETCLWSGPSWFVRHTCLANISEFKSLYSLFVLTLEIQNAGWTHYLDDIRASKNKCSATPSMIDEDFLEHIKRLYGVLDAEVFKQDWANGNAELGKELETYFAEESLIFDPKSRSWHPPSHCIWSEDGIQLPGKVSLATTYKNQQQFFQKILKITKPTLAMHINSLVQRAAGDPNKEEILEEMRSICALNPKADLLQQKLTGCKFLPIKTRSGTIEWMTHQSPFVITDRRDYGNLFNGKVNILDYTLEEVHSVRQLLDELGLGRNQLSILVKEETKVQNGQFDRHLTDDLRSKAYAISRCISHHGGSSAHDSFPKLQKMSVYTTESITSVLTVDQRDNKASVLCSQAYVHIDKSDSDFIIHVPKDVSRQQVCLMRQLPRMLLQTFGVGNLEHAFGLGSILTATSLPVVDDILQQDGIIEIDGIEQLTEPSVDGASVIVTDDTCYERPESPNLVEINVERASGSSVLRRDATNAISSFFRHSSAREPVPEFVNTTPSETGTYRQLLDNVIRQAQQLVSLPSQGSVSISSAFLDASNNQEGMLGTVDAEKRLAKIGAAGELFVFEYLKTLLLPQFTTDNWESSIRHLVDVHENYANLTQKKEKEVADIVYKDTSSRLTELFIKYDYLPPTVWTGCKPKYYIEVKATMSKVDTAFYCSQRQLDSMNSRRLSGIAPQDEIYLFVRVFGLGTQQMGMKIYMDPATLRDDKDLNFKLDTRYVITPGVTSLFQNLAM